MDNIKIIDNFLDQKYFNYLVAFFTKQVIFGKQLGGNKDELLQWCIQADLEGDYETPAYSPTLFFMTHLFYTDILANHIDGKIFQGAGNTCSPHFGKIMPLVEKFKDLKSLIRVKANLYPNTEILHEHEMHMDNTFPHYGAILSLNTCDGYTKMEDGTKVESIANRMLIFDASQKHCASTTTSKFARVNIIVNYLPFLEGESNKTDWK